MKKYSILVLASACLACTSLNKGASKAVNENSMQIAAQNQQWQTSQAIKLTADSADVQEEVLLWPKGIVKYSSANGFEGELKQISLRRRDKRHTLQNESKFETTLTRQEQVVQQQNKDLKQTAFKKKTHTNFGILGLVCLVILAVLAYLFYKRKITVKF